MAASTSVHAIFQQALAKIQSFHRAPNREATIDLPIPDPFSDRELRRLAEQAVRASRAVTEPRQSFSQGTPWQQQVWRAICAIPCGETRSYSELAALLGRPRSCRAVAAACAANTRAVAIPCHRVVSKDGSLSGYRWGVRWKRALLDAERSLASA